MKQTIILFASADHGRASALADKLRSDGETTVRVRDAGLFTAEQIEACDVVYVDGDFPQVVEAYPNAYLFPEPEAAAGEEGGRPMTVAELRAALTNAGVEIPADCTKKADLLALYDAKFPAG